MTDEEYNIQVEQHITEDITKAGWRRGSGTYGIAIGYNNTASGSFAIAGPYNTVIIDSDDENN